MTEFQFTSSLEREQRSARQDGATVYHQLREIFTAEQISDEVNKRPGTRRIGLILVDQTGSDVPMVGVSYGGDYRAEEEWGLPEISKGLLNEESQRIITGDVQGHWFLGLHANAGLRSHDPSESVQDNAKEALRRARVEAEWENRDIARMTMTELRALAKSELGKDRLSAAGITKLPRTKAELTDIVMLHVHKRPILKSVGEFHNGDTLILLPAEPVLTEALRILSRSRSHLRMGGGSAPFGRSATIFDERDLTAESVESQRVGEDYVDTQLARAKKVIAQMKSAGALYAFNPGRLAPLGKPLNDYYFVNFYPKRCPTAGGFYGWFSLEELAHRLKESDWTMESRAA